MASEDLFLTPSFATWEGSWIVQFVQSTVSKVLCLGVNQAVVTLGSTSESQFPHPESEDSIIQQVFRNFHL